MFLPIFLLILKFIPLSVLYIVLGNIIRTPINWNNNKYSNFFWISVDYFIGFIVYFVLLRSLAIIGHSFEIATYITTLASVAFIAIRRNSISISFKEYLKFALYFLPLFIIQLTLTIVFWIQSDLSDVFAIIGSLHAPRYANISHFILSTDTIPILHQNYAQAVMAAVPLIWGDKIILVSLTILLATTASFLALFINGLLKPYFADRVALFFATVLVFCGGLSVLPQFYLLIDSGYPWLLSGYSDSLIGLSSYVIVLLMFIDNFNKRTPINNWQYFFVGVSINFWGAAAIQNTILLGFLALIFFIIQIRNKQFNKKLFITFSVVFLVAAVIGVFEGGMVTPTALQSKVNIPGMMSIKKPNEKVIGISPGLPYHVLNNIKHVNSFGSLNYFWLGLKSDKESMPVKMVHALGLPILGLLLLLILLNFSWIKRSIKNLGEIDHEKIIVYASVLTFIGGLCIAFPFKISSFKWELSRFLIPGYFSCSVFAAVIFYNWGNRLKQKAGKLTLIIATIYLCVGTFTCIYRAIDNNFNSRNFQKNFASFCAPYNDFTKAKKGENY
ncbi:MAG: hypothetical protein JWR05_2097 [Mucilaginibacter sp.]|nr:hypothetical protein [Mucilaginibacter sp.]